MDSREMKRVPEEQARILDAHRLIRPVKLGALANELGVHVKVATLPSNVSGQIKKENNSYTIRVNRHESRQRQRFTIAHELAHFLLHRHIIDSNENGISDNVLYRSGAPERIEYEANRLAADILMPNAVVEQRFRTEYKGLMTEATIEALAQDFNVSKAAMEIRLSNLAEA